MHYIAFRYCKLQVFCSYHLDTEESLSQKGDFSKSIAWNIPYMQAEGLQRPTLITSHGMLLERKCLKIRRPHANTKRRRRPEITDW
jgi:hypothetical protein